MAAPAGPMARRLIEAPVRPGRRTKLLVRQLAPGEIALIDHRDLDRVSAEELLAAGVAAVLNCSPSSSGSYPNLGPQILLEAGIPLVDLDAVGGPEGPAGLLGRVRDGERLALALRGAGAAGGRRGELLRGAVVIARGRALELGSVRAQAAALRGRIDDALERFALNTIEHMRRERPLLAGALAIPRLATDMRERAALVAARGPRHRDDLRALAPFIRHAGPVILAVDGAADAVLDQGLQPQLIVGDMDSASERALRCGAELVVHAYPDGRAPGSERLRALGLPFSRVAAPGLSEDLALLIAAELGARPIVSLGSPVDLAGFLDRNRGGMASSFLTRLRLGELLVDARAVSLLHAFAGEHSP